MAGRKGGSRFHLDQQSVGHQQVCPIFTDTVSAKVDVNGNLLPDINVQLSQGHCQGILVDLLKEPVPQFVVNREKSTNDGLGQFLLNQSALIRAHPP